MLHEFVDIDVMNRSEMDFVVVNPRVTQLDTKIRYFSYRKSTFFKVNKR